MMPIVCCSSENTDASQMVAISIRKLQLYSKMLWKAGPKRHVAEELVDALPA